MSGNAQNPSSTSSLTWKNKGKENMHATDPSHVVVRLQQSRGLEDALRVHVLPESLETAELAVGEPCEILSEDGSIAYGIAWRAEDRMNTSRPKIRPAKMTEILRDLFDIKEGSKVIISKTPSPLYPAERIYLSDVTPTGHNKANAVDETSWKSNLAALFTNADALATGITFDATGKKKFRRRFHIDNIESNSAPTDTCLFTANDQTQLILPGETHSLPMHLANNSMSRVNGIAELSGSSAFNGEMDRLSLQHIQINTERIGGLVNQIKKLNNQMRRVLREAENINRPMHAGFGNPAVLLHGYEGCGKTLLLNAMSDCAFNKVIRLTRSTLTGGSVSKNQEIIKQKFKDAHENQPSLVLMDRLEQLVPTDDVVYSDILLEELERIKEHRIMVVGATRSPTDINNAVTRSGGFTKLIELPVPDLASRGQIMRALAGKVADEQGGLTSNIAARTHGFTGNDLSLLYTRMQESMSERYDDQYPTRATVVRTPSLPAYSETDEAANDVTSPFPWEFTHEDIEYALKVVKPAALREIFTETPKVTWNDIGGSEDIRAQFDLIIGMPQLHKDVLEKFNSKPQKGVLLYGPPGCSKTLTAQAVANSYNLNFIAIKGAEMISMYVGESEKAVREVFRKARAAAPCIIFFDEIDSIGASRKLGGGTNGLNVLTTLLNEMDGFETLRDVYVLAATNAPETLDPALMRPGRFDSHVYLGPPDEIARREILTISTRGTPLANDVYFDVLVKDTEGYSGAEIVALCEEARKPAMRRQCLEKQVDHRATAQDFKAARLKVKKGITREMLAGYEAFRNRE